MNQRGVWRVAHLSDLHIGLLSGQLRDWLSKGLIAQVNYLLQVNRGYNLSVLRALPSFLNSLSVDVVLISGDFTTAGSDRELRYAREFIDELRAANFICLYVPGNHDHYSRRQLESGYYGELYPQMSLERDGDLYNARFERRTLRRGDNDWDIWLLDQTGPTSWLSSNGCFEERTTGQLQTAQSQARNPAKNSLICGHFPLHNSRYGYRRLLGREALADALGERRENRLYAHGHTHQFHIVDERPQRGLVTVDAGSSTFKGSGGFNIYELGPQNAVIYRYQRAQDSHSVKWLPSQAFEWSWEPEGKSP